MIKPLRIKLVAQPGKLSEPVRHHLNTLDDRCFPEDMLYAKDGCYWWIAMTESGPVAFAGLKPLDGHNDGMAFLCRAGVISEAQGNGLQRRLIAARVRHAQRMKFREVVTYTSRDNYKSAANLLRSGFHFYTPQQEWAHPVVALYFRLDLNR